MAQWNFLHPKPIVLFYRCSHRPILIDKHAELDVQIVKNKRLTHPDLLLAIRCRWILSPSAGSHL